MNLRYILKRTVPDPIRHIGWRAYYRILDNNWLKSRLKTIVGCQTTQKIVALTFDDGPNLIYTPQILDILAHYRVKATFFLLGRNVTAHPETAKLVAKQGHTLGNHTFSHPCLADCSFAQVVNELAHCQQTIREATGIAPQLMRPPYGLLAPVSFITARLLGYQVVNWSVSGEDWNGEASPLLAERVLRNIQPGGIILLHDGWEPSPHQTESKPENDLFQDRSPTIKALPMIIEPLQRQGYQFVTLSEMIRMKPLTKQSWFV